MKKVVIAILTMVLIGCGEVTIDATSKEALQASMAKMKENLTVAEREELQKAIMVIAFDGAGNIFQIAANPDLAIQSASTKLHGLTKTQILMKRDEIKAKREAEKIAEAKLRAVEVQKEIEQLEQEKKEALDALALLESKVPTFDAKFYIKSTKYMEKPVIEISLTNNTDTAISRAYFSSRLVESGRSVPHLVEDFNFTIAGGIEPGETYSAVLEPNMFSKWGSVKGDTSKMDLLAVLTRIDGPDDKPIYNSSFSDRKESKLAALQAELTKLQAIASL